MFGNLANSSVSMSRRFSAVGSRNGLSVRGRSSRTKSLGLWLDPYDGDCTALPEVCGASGVTGTVLGAILLQSLVRLVDLGRSPGRLGTDSVLDSVRLRLLFRDPASSAVSCVVPLSSA